MCTDISQTIKMLVMIFFTEFTIPILWISCKCSERIGSQGLFFSSRQQAEHYYHHSFSSHAVKLLHLDKCHLTLKTFTLDQAHLLSNMLFLVTYLIVDGWFVNGRLLAGSVSQMTIVIVDLRNASFAWQTVHCTSSSFILLTELRTETFWQPL